jgi:hypothetical protein
MNKLESINTSGIVSTIKVTSHHLTLQQLIDQLEAYPYPDKVIPIGFHNPHSYRGYYDDLAFEITYNTTPKAMLECAKQAMNNTYTGYKGGEFTMGTYTECWLVDECGAENGKCGESLGALLLDLLLSLSSNG